MTNSTAAAPAAIKPSVALAPAWHTSLLIAGLLLYSFSSGNLDRELTLRYGRLASYLWTIILDWIVVGYILAATRKRGVRLAELVGGRWRSWRGFLKDVAIAMAFWICSAVVLAAVGFLVGVISNATALRRSLDFMVPGNTVERIGWVLLSVSAGGFCEEVIFRGYLQRQFGLWLRSEAGGVLLSALVFGGAHTYEGHARMVVLAVYGALFGALAVWRRSLRPGMLAHAWHDSLSGLTLSLLRAAGK